VKVLDAMASGKAMVSTTIGCEGIEVTPGEHLEIADAPEAFAAKTVALLGDTGRRLELGRAARGLVEQRYAWSVVGDQLMDAYGRARARQEQGR
jgi:glycosyltransferase involved in cell wall biosynthesis